MTETCTDERLVMEDRLFVDDDDEEIVFRLIYDSDDCPQFTLWVARRGKRGSIRQAIQVPVDWTTLHDLGTMFSKNRWVRNIADRQDGGLVWEATA